MAEHAAAEAAMSKHNGMWKTRIRRIHADRSDERSISYSVADKQRDLFDIATPRLLERPRHRLGFTFRIDRAGA